MECRGQLDASRRCAAGHPLRHRFACLILIFCCALGRCAQSPHDAEVLLDQLKQLSAGEQWQEVIRLTDISSPAETSHRSADLDYYYGMALARLGRWDEAAKAFRAGIRLKPNDKRFPLELAGVAFKQKNYSCAVSNLRRALELDPDDSYASDFLASVYFLQNNLQAALKYWNRVGKPRIENGQAEPTPRVDPVLLDRAFAFSPAGT